MQSPDAVAKLLEQTQKAEAAIKYFRDATHTDVESVLLAEHEKNKSTPQILWDLVDGPETPENAYTAFALKGFSLDNAFPIRMFGVVHGASKFLTHLFSDPKLYRWAALITQKISPDNLAHQLARKNGLLIDTLLDKFPYSRDLLEAVVDKAMESKNPLVLTTEQKARLEFYSPSIYDKIYRPEEKNEIELHEMHVGAFHHVAYAPVMRDFVSNPKRLISFAKADQSEAFMMVARCYLEKMLPEDFSTFIKNSKKDNVSLGGILSEYLINAQNRILMVNLTDPRKHKTFYGVRALFDAGKVDSRMVKGNHEFYCPKSDVLAERVLFKQVESMYTSSMSFNDFREMFVKGLPSRFKMMISHEVLDCYYYSATTFARVGTITLDSANLAPILGSLDKDDDSYKNRSLKLLFKIFNALYAEKPDEWDIAQINALLLVLYKHDAASTMQFLKDRDPTFKLLTTETWAVLMKSHGLDILNLLSVTERISLLKSWPTATWNLLNAKGIPEKLLELITQTVRREVGFYKTLVTEKQYNLLGMWADQDFMCHDLYLDDPEFFWNNEIGGEPLAKKYFEQIDIYLISNKSKTLDDLKLNKKIFQQPIQMFIKSPENCFKVSKIVNAKKEDEAKNIDHGPYLMSRYLEAFEPEQLRALIEAGRGTDPVFLERLIGFLGEHAPLAVVEFSESLDFNPMNKNVTLYSKTLCEQLLKAKKFDLVAAIVRRIPSTDIEFLFDSESFAQILKPMIDGLPASEACIGAVLDRLQGMEWHPYEGMVRDGLPGMIKHQPFPTSLIERVVDMMVAVPVPKLESWMRDRDYVGLLLGSTQDGSIGPAIKLNNVIPQEKYTKRLMILRPAAFPPTYASSSSSSSSASGESQVWTKPAEMAVLPPVAHAPPALEEMTTDLIPDKADATELKMEVPSVPQFDENPLYVTKLLVFTNIIDQMREKIASLQADNMLKDAEIKKLKGGEGTKPPAF